MRRLLVLLGMLSAMPALAQFEETIVVGRTILNVRIVDRAGKAILGLQPEDMVATIDGKPAEIKSVTWVPETGDRELEPEILDAIVEHGLEMPPQGRLFVFYFQTDFARNQVRVSGQMYALLYVDRIIERVIQPGDRVAVLSFDSHLRFHLDFTSNKREIRNASRRTLEVREPKWPPAVPEPSLAMCLDREKMRRFARDEEALLHIAEALREIPGEKQLIFVGTRLGTRVAGRFMMDRVWEEARRQLLAADVVVNGFYAMPFGVTGNLGIGVRTAAAETGGFFVTASHTGVTRMEQGELAGHYEIELRIPEDLPLGAHEIAIRGKTRKEIVIDATLTLSEQ
jgi:hypothetical protein